MILIDHLPTLSSNNQAGVGFSHLTHNISDCQVNSIVSLSYAEVDRIPFVLFNCI